MTAELFLAAALASAAGGVGYLIVVHAREKESRRRERLALRDGFRAGLVQHLRTRGTSRDFRFAEHAERCGVDPGDAAGVADDIYLQFCRKSVSDGVVTGDERKRLVQLARFLSIDPGRAGTLESQAKSELYRDAVKGVLADGVVTAEEAAELEALRVSLQIDEDFGLSVTEDLSRDAYLAMLDRVVSGGVVTQALRDDLARLKRALAIKDSDAQQFISRKAEYLYRQLFTFVRQDGVITDDEQQALDWLQEEAALAEEVVRPFREKIKAIRKYSEYREGRLPTVQTRLILQSGELCHWLGYCNYVYTTTSGYWREVQGQLAVTSKSIMLTAPEKSVRFVPSRIIDIRLLHNGVVVETAGQGGGGHYRVADPEELEAVLTGLVRKHKYLASGGQSGSRTRHIPRDVRAEVWSRDGAKCVSCGAGEYLEFDHIIPHAKGGANTVNNVQLLCRKCNAEKSDRI